MLQTNNTKKHSIINHVMDSLGLDHKVLTKQKLRPCHTNPSTPSPIPWKENWFDLKIR